MPKQLKTNEFQNGMFLKPSSFYKYRGDNLQHSVVNNNEIQSRNPWAVALSTHARLRFSSSASLLLGAFDLIYLRNDTKNGSFRPWTYQFYFFFFEWQFPAVNILILLLLLLHVYFYFHFIIKMFCFELKIKKNKCISSSMKKKIILLFTFTSFSIQNN